MSSKNKKNAPSKKSGKSANKKNVSSKNKNSKKETLPEIVETKPSKIPLKPQRHNFKQIEYKSDENKLYLVDYNNNNFECNLYGEPIPSFHTTISGTAHYKQRLLSKQIQPLTFEYDQLYHPLPQNFEGYFPYPRPLSLPFLNECSNPSLFIKQLKRENRFNTLPNKHIINLTLPSKTKQFKLTYLTSTLHANEQETKKYLLKLIDSYIRSLLKQNPFHEERVMKSANVKALLKFQKILKINMGEVNGMRLQSAPKEYKETFDIVSKLTHRKLLRKSKSLSKGMDDMYKEMYSIRNVPNNGSRLHTEMDLCMKENKEQMETISDVTKGRNVKKVKFNRITNYTETTGFGLTTNRLRGNGGQNCFEDLYMKEDLSFLSMEEIPVDDGKNKKVYKGGDNLVNGWEDNKEVGKEFWKTANLFRHAGASYLKEIGQLQKVNPIAYKKEEMKEKADMENYKKKKLGKLIYEKIKIKK